MIYQEDFRIPGISPSFAASRKHARHIPKSRMNARLRPQRKQRRTTRDLNLGGRFERATVDFFAMNFLIHPELVEGLTFAPGYSPFLGSYDSVGLPRPKTKRHLTEKRSPVGLEAIYSIGLRKSNSVIFWQLFRKNTRGVLNFLSVKDAWQKMKV